MSRTNNYNSNGGAGSSDFNLRHGLSTTGGASQFSKPGLRRPHLYGNHGSNAFTSSTNNAGASNPLPTTTTSSFGASITRNKRHVSSSSTSSSQQSLPLPTSSEYFSRDISPMGQSQSPTVPVTRFGSRISHKVTGSAGGLNAYGLPPTPESDVSQPRASTPQRQPRDYQFNIDMMQRMTQHAKVSPLSRFANLNRDGGDGTYGTGEEAAHGIHRVGGSIYKDNRAHDGISSAPGASRRTGQVSSDAVEGAREASRRLIGASTVNERPSSMYELASKPMQPSPTTSMYDELKRTLSESSSERPKRVVRMANARQLPPLEASNKRHVEVRPRRPIRSASTSTSSSTSAAVQPPVQQNSYYTQDVRPTTSHTQTKQDPITNVDWLAAGQDITEGLPKRTRHIARTRAASSGTPLTRPNHQREEFGGELQSEPRETHPRQPFCSSSYQFSQTIKREEPDLEPVDPRPSHSFSSSSFMQQDLLDFVSEDDLTLNLHKENLPPAPAVSRGAAPRSDVYKAGVEVPVARTLKTQDPDETLDTLRQLSRLLSTPVKHEEQPPVEYKPSGVLSAKPVNENIPITKLTSVSSAPLPRERTAAQYIRPNSKPSNTKLSSKPAAATKPSRTRPQPAPSKTPTSKSIQFEDGYETDDSLDRLLTNDTDYHGLLQPAVFEDESFLQGSAQVACSAQGPTNSTRDLEAMALRAKVLNNLQTVQLDIRETRKGLENIERRFGILEGEGVFDIPPNNETTLMQPQKPTKSVRTRYVYLTHKKQKPVGKGLFRKPWGFFDFFCAGLLVFAGLLVVEYKLWSDTIIPQYSTVSSDEWFARHPVGQYQPGGTFRALLRLSLWVAGYIWIGLEYLLAFSLWILSGIQWVEDRVMDAVNPPPPEFSQFKAAAPSVVPPEAVIDAATNNIITTIATLSASTSTYVADIGAETILPL